MSFNTAQFALFFVITVALYYILPRKTQNTWLFSASAFFYAYAAPQYSLYIIGSIFFTYCSGSLLQRFKAPFGRKLVLALTIILNLSMLCLFKYFNFFSKSISIIISYLGGTFSPTALQLIAPIGISFYTFTTIGYLVDVYRRDVCAEKNIIDYSLFVSFFPHIMSGPIARANSLLPQLKNPRAFKFENLTDGAQRFIYGLLKKAVVADWLATFNNAILYKLHSENPLTILAAVLLFSLQLYFDFSGYCDMALGCARMLGIDLIENFKAPYFSKSFSEIWSRWHISLTGWFRDYIYIPLGGNRKGLFRKMLNIAVVFLISGLWHGAAWGFIVWGLLHGALRIIEDCFRAVCNKRDKQHPKMQSSFMSILKTGCVYFVWSLTFVFFRLDSVSESIYAITRCFAVSEFSARSLAARGLAIMQANTVSSFGYIVALLIIVALSALFVLVCEYKFIYKSTDKTSDRNTCFVLRNFTKNTRFAITAIMILAIMLTGRFGVSSFVYFQF